MTREAAQPLRILILGDYGIAQGGAEVSMLQLRTGLRQRGHEVMLLSSSAGAKSNPGLPSFSDRQVFGTDTSLRTLVQTRNPIAMRQVRKTVRAFKPDLVHLNMFLTQLSPDVLDALEGVPVLHMAHWYRLICMTGLKMLPDGKSCPYPAGRACLENRCIPLRDWLLLTWQLRRLQQKRKAIHAIVVASKTVRERLEKEGVQVDFVIPYGIDPLPPRPPLTDPPRVGFAGRLVAAKGGEILIRAFASVLTSLPDCRLDIFGAGDEYSRLCALCQSLGISSRVEFHGWLDPDELHQRMARCWVHAAVSVFEEPFGITAVEAAMRGTAVVATDNGGFRETIIEDVTGLLVPPQDIAATASALSRLLGNRELAERMGQAGRRHAEANFGMERFIDSTLAACRETMRRQRAHAC